MKIAGRHWTTAFVTAVLIHVGVALAVLSRAPEMDVEHAAPAGIRVSLGAAAGTPDRVLVAGSEMVAAEVATAREVVAVASTAAWMQAASEFPALQPIRAAEIRAAEAVPSTMSPRLDSTFAAAPVAPKESTPIEESLPVDPAGVTFAETPRAVESAKETWVETSLPGERESVMPVEVPEIRQAVPVARVGSPSRTQAVARTPSTPAGHAATGTVDGVAGVATSIGSPAPRVRADYLTRVQAWIEKHKEYPNRARLRREEGTALLYFVVDRDGRVRDYELRQSTGHALLDREVLAMIERAQPLPRVLGHLNPVALEMIVPVRFSLR